MDLASVILPAGLAERTSNLIGRSVRKAQAAVGGFSNLVFFVDDDLVVKAASAELKRIDLAQEALALASITDLELGGPRLLHSSQDDEWSILVTSLSVGSPPAVDWGRFVHELSGAPDRAQRLGASMGHRLRRIHDAAPFPGNGLASRIDLLQAGVGVIESRIMHGEQIPDELGSQMICALGDEVHERGTTFLHGDFGLHNLLLDDPFHGALVSGVLDWELSGWGNAITDLAWLSWTLWLRHLPPEVWTGFVSTYGAWAAKALGWEPELVRTMVLSQMALLLVRTEPETAVRDVWISRAAALSDFVVPSIGYR
jgi:aminoglycoside phosphotransferase (APT) family kinase protein